MTNSASSLNFLNFLNFVYPKFGIITYKLKIIRMIGTYKIENLVSHNIAGWCNGSTPGSLPGDSVRVGARSHIAEWTSQFKSSGSLPEERRSVADLCIHWDLLPQ